MEYDFTLKFALPSADQDHAVLAERLGAAGCDDALVGTGAAGRLGVNFIRESDSAINAVTSAIRDVLAAIPGAILVEAAPDYVGLSDVAELVGVSRQYLRKLMSSNPDFPSPLHAGHTQLWHLEAVLHWLTARCSYEIQQSLTDLAHATMQCNLATETKKIEPAMRARLLEFMTR